MNILVIYTGGTIGSIVSDGWISVSKNADFGQFDKLKSQDKSIKFDTVSPYTILSENLSGKELTILVDCVNENIDKGYDGIIVTHGTDTIQYTAASLGITIGDDTIPVVLVSSNYPLEDERANGRDNFEVAVRFIKSGTGKGVFVSYKNKNQPVAIHRGSKLVRHTEMSDEIRSVNDCVFAYLDNGKIIPNPNFYDVPGNSGIGKVDFCENPNILSVLCHPGDRYDYSVENYNCVVLQPYHSGTLDTGNENFVSFCKKAKEKRVPVFVVNGLPGDAYSTTKIYDNMGLCVLTGYTFPYVYVKLWIAISLNKNLTEFVK